MAQADDNFSTVNISSQLIESIISAVKDKAYGSVEIYIQNFTVTQITEKTITKVTQPANGHKKAAGPALFKNL